MSRGTPESDRLYRAFAYEAFTLFGRLSQNLSANTLNTFRRSLPRYIAITVWALPISLAATLRIDLSFSSSPYLDVSVQEVPSVYLCIHYTVTELFSAGLPHSEICGSMDICSSPQLFAAYHVFHRLSVPRHPPCALFCLISPDRAYSVTPCLSLQVSLDFPF